jgi:hypothetical protein
VGPVSDAFVQQASGGVGEGGQGTSIGHDLCKLSLMLNTARGVPFAD